MKKTFLISLLTLFFGASFAGSYAVAGQDVPSDMSLDHGKLKKKAIMQEEPTMAVIPPAEKTTDQKSIKKQPPQEEPAMAIIPDS